MSWIKKLLKPLLWVAIAILAIVAFYLAAVAIGAFAGGVWATGSLATAWTNMVTALAVSWTSDAMLLPVVGSVSIGMSMSSYVVVASVVLAIGGYLASDVLTDIFTTLGLVEDEQSGTVMTSTRVGLNPATRPNVINFDDDGVDRQRSILVDPNDGVNPAYRVTRVVGEPLDISSPPSREGLNFDGWTTNVDSVPRASSSIVVAQELTLVTGNWSLANDQPDPTPDEPAVEPYVVKFRVKGVVTHTRVVKPGDAIGLLPSYDGSLLNEDEFIDHWELDDGRTATGITSDWIPTGSELTRYADAVIVAHERHEKSSATALLAAGGLLAALLVSNSSVPSA